MPYKKLTPVVSKNKEVFQLEEQESLLNSVDLNKFNKFLDSEIEKLGEKKKLETPKAESAQDIAKNILNLRNKLEPNFDNIKLDYNFK